MCKRKKKKDTTRRTSNRSKWDYMRRGEKLVKQREESRTDTQTKGRSISKKNMEQIKK